MSETAHRTIFENIGGSFQYRVREPRDLALILDLDPALWAALCVPVASLNGDPAFFRALDGDGNGVIRVDEIREAIAWLFAVLTDIDVLADPSPEFAPEWLNADHPDGGALRGFIADHAAELLSDNRVDLERVRTKLHAVTSGPITGDGILSFVAVSGSGGEALFNELVKLTGGTPAADGSVGLGTAQLEKFLADARSFLDWAATAERPLFRNADPVPYYDAFKGLNVKIDEYFRFCELIRIDPANAARFRMQPDALSPLELSDAAAVNATLSAAPLALPDAECRLRFDDQVNPFYRKAAEKFAAAFGLTELTVDTWEALKSDLAGYIAYLKKAQGDLAGSLGRSRLESYLGGPAPEILRRLFTEDKALGGVVNALRQLERLLLHKKYLIEFVNNFVNFEAFFDPDRNSMLQAGRLIMDGRSYHLAVWIGNIAEHRKIAVRSNLCLLYLEVMAAGSNAAPRQLAVAVTGGSLNRIYIGKPAFFIDNADVTYHGKVIDLIEGPISFGQTVMAPFHRFSSAMGEKIQKLTDFTTTEKQLTDVIKAGQPAAAAPSGPFKALLGNGSLMLLAGGLSVAALGAAASFILKSVTGAIATLSALPGWVLLLWLAIILGLFLIPATIFAFLKMRKRNLTVFLEAGGWAVNLPMRLNFHVSGIFTRPGVYPKGTRFVIVSGIRRYRALIVWMVVLLALGVLLWAALHYGWFI